MAAGSITNKRELFRQLEFHLEWSSRISRFPFFLSLPALHNQACIRICPGCSSGVGSFCVGKNTYTHFLSFLHFVSGLELSPCFAPFL